MLANISHSAFTEQYGNFEDTAAIDLYQKLLHETDPARQRAVMREFEKHTLDDQVHNIPTLWVVSDRAAPLLCQRLEDQPEPLR
jgi:ABC-type transport system substrate-binding protein